MLKRLVVTAFLALGLTACGPASTDEAPITEGVEQPMGPQPEATACDMDGCPSGMCAITVAASGSCPGGYVYYCTTIVRGQTRCI